MGRSSIVTVVLIAVAVLAAFGALNSYQVSSEYAAQYKDAYGAESARIRFAPVLQRLPSTGEVGYFSDLNIAQPAAVSAFLAAQYTLAPRRVLILEQGSTPEWAVGNFSKPQDYAAAGEAHGYSLDADVGNGVVLFRRKATQ